MGNHDETSRLSSMAMTAMRWLIGWHFLYEGDYQLVEDVNIANKVFENGLPERKRPWHG